MEIKQLSPQVFVSDQITTTDVSIVAAQGIKTIVNNRPDDEAQVQPKSADLAAAAAEHDMQFVDLPVVSGNITDEDIEKFEQSFGDLEAPVLLFCRTGSRSTVLWALAETKKMGVDAVMSAASGAGYDLSALRTRLVSRSEQSIQAKPIG